MAGKVHGNSWTCTCNFASPPAQSAMRWVKCHAGTRDARGHLTQFAGGPADFRPNLTPREMLLKGMHGGIYFNPKGGKPGILYPRGRHPHGIPGVTISEYPKEWFEGVPVEAYASRRYSVVHNCYGVKSGLDQRGWEEHGWIKPCDPRGWTQWYFRYFLGRRLDDGEDERQIGRWRACAGAKGRWKSNLIAKCLRDGKAYDDATASPVVRQTLLHWAYELNRADFEAGATRVRRRGAAYVPRSQLAHVLAPGGPHPPADDEEEGERARAAEAKAEASRLGREERAARRGATGGQATPPTKRQCRGD